MQSKHPLWTLQVRKLQHYQPPHGLNKGNIAHYSIVRHVTETTSMLEFVLLRSRFCVYEYKNVFFFSFTRAAPPSCCCAESELCIDLE